MDRETLKQKINYELSLRNSNFTLALVTASGTISLFFHLKSITEIIMFTLGFFLSLGFFNGTFQKEDLIEKLIKLHERSK